MPTPRFDIDLSPTEGARPRGFWLGFVSLLVGLTLIAPPISVLYKANDEALRTSSGAPDSNVFATLYRTPPLAVERGTYVALRVVCVAAALNAVLIAITGAIVMRSREFGVRLLGVNAVAHVVLAIAMIIVARRFTIALDEATARLPWYGQAYGSGSGRTAMWAAAPAIVYPLALLFLFVRHRRGHRRRRLV